MRNRRHALVGLSFVLLLQARVGAGQPVTSPEGRLPIAPGLSVTPAVFFETGYDSNYLRTTTGVPGSENYVAPQIEGWLNREQFRIGFQSALARQSESGIANWNNFNSIEVNREGGLFTLRGMASRRNHYAPPTDFAGFEIGIKSRRVEKTLEGELGIRPQTHRVYGAVTVGRLGLRYDADARFQGSSLRFNLNRDTTIVSLKTGWAATPLTSVIASVSFLTDKFLYVQGSDGAGHNLMVGVETKPSALMTGILQFGQLTYRDKATGRTFKGPSFNTAMVLQEGPATLTVNGSREIKFSFNAGSGFYVQTGLDTYMSMQLGESMEPFVRHLWRDVSHKGPSGIVNPDDDIGVQRLKAGLAFKVGQMRVGPEVEKYEHRGAAGFNGYRAIVFMIYGSHRILWMDRPLIGQW